MRTCSVCGWRSDSTAGHLCRIPEPVVNVSTPEQSTFTVTLSPGFFGDDRLTHLKAILDDEKQRREDAKVRALYVGGWAKVAPKPLSKLADRRSYR